VKIQGKEKNRRRERAVMGERVEGETISSKPIPFALKLSLSHGLLSPLSFL
jgi:hypothetical protein